MCNESKQIHTKKRKGCFCQNRKKETDFYQCVKHTLTLMLTMALNWLLFSLLNDAIWYIRWHIFTFCLLTEKWTKDKNWRSKHHPRRCNVSSQICTFKILYAYTEYNLIWMRDWQSWKHLFTRVDFYWNSKLRRVDIHASLRTTKRRISFH